MPAFCFKFKKKFFRDNEISGARLNIYERTENPKVLFLKQARLLKDEKKKCLFGGAHLNSSLSEELSSHFLSLFSWRHNEWKMAEKAKGNLSSFDVQRIPVAWWCPESYLQQPAFNDLQRASPTTFYLFNSHICVKYLVYRAVLLGKVKS